MLPILSNYLKIRDDIIGIVSLVAQAYAYILVAFAVTPLMMYLCNDFSATILLISYKMSLFK